MVGRSENALARVGSAVRCSDSVVGYGKCGTCSERIVRCSQGVVGCSESVVTRGGHVKGCRGGVFRF